MGRTALPLPCCQICRTETERPGCCRDQHLHEFCFHILVNKYFPLQEASIAASASGSVEKNAQSLKWALMKDICVLTIFEISPTFKQYTRFSFHEQLFASQN